MILRQNIKVFLNTDCSATSAVARKLEISRLEWDLSPAALLRKRMSCTLNLNEQLIRELRWTFIWNNPFHSEVHIHEFYLFSLISLRRTFLHNNSFAGFGIPFASSLLPLQCIILVCAVAARAKLTHFPLSSCLLRR